jgi:signal transduction histidine kinase
MTDFLRFINGNQSISHQSIEFPRWRESMFLSHLKISSRFLCVLGIAFAVQTGISIQSVVSLRRELIADRQLEVKHLDEAAYSIVASYHDRAVKGLMSDAAAREAARNDVRALRYDGDNYYFIWDRDGVGVAHGSHPEFEGVNYIDSPQAKKLPYVSNMVSNLVAVGRTPTGEGFTSYYMTKPGGTKPIYKIAYNRLFAPWGWNIGTGAYVDDIDAAFWIHARNTILMILGMMAVACLASYILARDFSLALHRLSGRIERVAAGELDGEVPDTERGDEVGAMARALIVLRDTSSLAAILEERVKLRTQQLEEMQGELIKKERLSTIGQITATVAHELRNPLSAIRNSLFVLKEMASGQASAIERPASRIERGIVRCEHIISDLLNFTRTTQARLSSTVGDAWLHQVLDDYVVPDGLVLERRLDAPGAIVALDQERFQRVLINLLDNGAHALQSKNDGERRMTVSTILSGSFEIVVEDTGPGISPEILPKIFEPLFTTKSFGTGLGLPTVKQIVEQHGGSISVESEIGVGTRAHIRLPCAAVQTAAA